MIISRSTIFFEFDITPHQVEKCCNTNGERFLLQIVEGRRKKAKAKHLAPQLGKKEEAIGNREEVINKKKEKL